MLPSTGHRHGQVELPKDKGDYRGISVTPAIAIRLFEETIYCTHAQEVIKEHLSPTQFAYRKGGYCTGALSALQHRINSYLDNPNWRAIRVFTMDFSKAFDSVKHDLLASSVKSLHSYMVQKFPKRWKAKTLL